MSFGLTLYTSIFQMSEPMPREIQPLAGSHSTFLGGPPLRALLLGTGSQQP